uniref:Uncharacterized protein n=1 Tax=Timema cristinae TaxID=61476 RepID=A0A7R9GYA3_TIMCR|nr:unnamed protein product [Timema cristinae]
MLGIETKHNHHIQPPDCHLINIYQMKNPYDQPICNPDPSPNPPASQECGAYTSPRQSRSFECACAVANNVTSCHPLLPQEWEVSENLQVFSGSGGYTLDDNRMAAIECANKSMNSNRSKCFIAADDDSRRLSDEYPTR